MTKQDYAKLVKAHSPRSPLAGNCLRAFVVGGGICAAAQLLRRGLESAGVGREQAGTAVCLLIIAAAALLTGLGVFDTIAKFAGAGTLVPICGFANAMAAPALEFRTEGLVTGTAVKIFTLAGPVLVYGTAASVVYGVIYWIAGAP